jgi:hypothetical protein
VNGKGNPWVKICYPYPYLFQPLPLPLRRVLKELLSQPLRRVLKKPLTVTPTLRKGFKENLTFTLTHLQVVTLANPSYEAVRLIRFHFELISYNYITKWVITTLAFKNFRG